MDVITIPTADFPNGLQAEICAVLEYFIQLIFHINRKIIKECFKTNSFSSLLKQFKQLITQTFDYNLISAFHTLA